MKNRYIYLLINLFLNLIIISNLYSQEIFNFNVSELEITQNGNLYKGVNGGEILTNDGVSITSENFEYNKLATSLIAYKNVQLKDSKKNIIIYADEILYIKSQEFIVAKGNVSLNDTATDTVINAGKISYSKNKEEIIASDKVEFIDSKKDIVIESEKITYLKKLSKIITEGITKGEIYSKYNFDTKDITFFKDEMILSSSDKTIIIDDEFTLFELSSFNFEIKNEFLKGTDIAVIHNSKVPLGESDKLYFKNGFFDLKNKNFKTGETKIELKKDIFDRSENDPRIYGVSSSQKNGITSVKKASFTSCKKNDDCPPWKLEASEIKHDKNKKQIIYDDAVLKVYDVPVFYFPKFFHPDPTVQRQSGFLIPKLNKSNILGSSLSIPYFHVISENKDFTFKPTIFSKSTTMFQNEFRQKNKSSSLIADFAIINNFESSITKQKKNVKHLFAKFSKNLQLDNFDKSELNLFIEKTNKDTYLKIFEDNISDSSIKPKNNDILNSGLDFNLENKKFLLSGGVDVFEDLTKLHSDRYQYVLPYFDFTRNLFNLNLGTVSLNSSGNNILDNTNNVKSKVINNIEFKMNDKILSSFGIKNNFNFYLKNLNSVGKNVGTYKSSPQIELQSLFEFNSELPLRKFSKINNETLIPRFSLRLNPGDMKNHSNADRKINMSNIFDINRLGLDDSFESGNSITVGIDYKKENKQNRGDNFEFKLASVFREDIEDNMPVQSSLNQKNSNLFGSFDYNKSNFLNLNYNFALDNKIEVFKYNSVGLGLSLNNFITEFNFIKERSNTGNSNIFENSTSYNFNSSNSLAFKTRRNREINLTEYYDLVYEYKNDCLTAGIKFNKTYYEDRDLKPTQNLMFTISFYPLTSIDQSLN